MPGQFSLSDVAATPNAPPPSSPAGRGQFSSADIAPKTDTLADIGDTLKQYWQQVSPVAQAQGVADIANDPKAAAKGYGAQTGQLGQSAIDSFKKGEYAQGIRHTLSYFLNGIPGVGALLDRAGNKAGSGDYKGAIADTAALATQIAEGKLLPAALDAATEPGVAGHALSAVTQPVKDFAVGHPAITKAAGAVTGGAVGHLVPVPGATAFGAVVGREMAQDWLKDRVPSEAAAPAAAPAPINPLLDQIAQSTAGKKFSALDPAAQATVQKIADAANKTQAATAPAQVPVPTAPPAAAPAEAPPPVAANPAKAAFEAAKANGTAPAAPEVQVIPAKESPSAEVFKARARAERAANVGPVADALEAGGVTGEDAAKLSPGDWKRLSKAEGVNVNITPKLASALIEELQARAATRELAKMQEGIAAAGRRGTMMSPSPEYARALGRKGALKAAEALAAEMNR